MDTNIMPRKVRGLSITAFIFAVLGGAFFWWDPMGIVLSIAGLLFGFADWTAARRRSLDYRLSIVAMLLSLVALAVDIVVVYFGFQLLTLGR